METNTQALQRRVSKASVTRPVVDAADHLLALLQRDTLKTFFLLISEVFLECLEESGTFHVQISVPKSEYLVGVFQPNIDTVPKGERYIHCGGRQVKRANRVFRENSFVSDRNMMFVLV